MIQIRLARRSFLTRFGLGASAFSATALGAAVPAEAQVPAGTRSWQPAQHAEDDWFDQPAAKHRFFFDTSTADGFGAALLFANNYFTANRSGYSLSDTDLALVICARHQSTQFAFTDDMWAKYPAPFADRSKFTDPNTKKPATVNVYRASGYGAVLPSMGTTLDAVIRRGVRFAVCQMATRATAGAIARSTGGNADDVYKELTEHLIPNAHLVPAGIVAVNRAQERGYSLASV